MRTQLETLKNLFFSSEKSKQAVSEYWRNEFLENPYYDGIYITIDLVIADGNVLRLAVNEFSVSYGSQKIGYQPFLINEPSIESSYELLSGDGTQRSIGIEIDGRIVKASEVVNSGTFIAGIGEISLQKKDGDYNSRMVLLRGEIGGGVVFGATDEIVSLSLMDSVVSNNLIIPEYYIVKDDFPDMPDNQIGQRFPLIIGSYEGGVPCIRITNHQYGPLYLIGYGWQIQVTYVSIDGRKIEFDDPERGWEIKKSTTPSGIPYTYIDFNFPSSLSNDGYSDTEYSSDWNDPNSTDPTGSYEGVWGDSISVYAGVEESGLYPEKSTLLEQIKYLIVYYSGFKEAGFDIASYNRALAKDPGLKIQTLINGSDANNTATVLEFIQSTIADSFPMISLIYTGIGLGIIFSDRRQAIINDTFIVGQSGIIDRASQFEESSTEDVYNVFSLKYNYNTEEDTFEKHLIVDETNNKFCAISQTKLGRREYDIIESVVIFDDSTAEYVLGWLAAHVSIPRYIVEYTASPSLFLYINVGDNIKITDVEMGFINITSTITKIVYNKDELLITVNMWILHDNLEKLSGSM